VRNAIAIGFEVLVKLHQYPLFAGEINVEHSTGLTGTLIGLSVKTVKVHRGYAMQNDGYVLDHCSADQKQRFRTVFFPDFS